MSTRPPSFPPRSAPTRRDDLGSGVAVVETDRELEPSVGEQEEPVAQATRVSDGLADRLAERRRARRRLRVRAVAAIAVGVIVLAGLGYAAFVSPVLALQEDAVTVTGATEHVDEDAILALVREDEGEPLLRIDTQELRQNLLGVVGVADVSIQRAFPHGLDITVEPRVPVATVKEDGRFVLLDRDGVELARTTEQPDGVPLVRVPVGTSNTGPALAAVIDVMAALPPDILDQVTEASAKTAYEVEFELASGAQVIWGTVDDGALKVDVLAALLQVPAQVYDVSAPLSPITR